MRIKQQGMVTSEVIFAIGLLTIALMMTVSIILYTVKHNQIMIEGQFAVDKVSVNSTCQIIGSSINTKCLKNDLDNELNKIISKKNNNISFTSTLGTVCGYNKKASIENCFVYNITVKQKLFGFGSLSFTQTYVSVLEKLNSNRKRA